MQSPAARNRICPPSSFALRKDPLYIRRLGRTCLWQDPSLYRWIGRLRGRGDCFQRDYDLWIDGFPGSATALTASAFQQANPGVRLGGRWHTPPFILQALFSFKPGIFLVRQPADAVISWTILSNRNLGECLDYYNDFHRALAPQAPWLFVVPFDEAMSRFATVIEGFNVHYHTNYSTPAQNPAAFLATEGESQPRPEPAVRELRIIRPVAAHSDLKQELRLRLHESPRLRRKLERARQFHLAFVPGGRTRVPQLNVSTRHLPSLA